MMRVFTLALFVSLTLSSQTTCDTVTACQAAISANVRDSQAHYRLAEFFLEAGNFQSAAIEFNAALKGDPGPEGIAARAHLQLGKIFDRTDQRDRAIREYEIVLQMPAASSGEKKEAAQYLANPFTR